MCEGEEAAGGEGVAVAGDQADGVVLADRFYERFADHAVSVAKRVVYLVTGTYVDDVRARLDSPARGPG